MKVSLKLFLISVCAVGAAIGIMTRLLLESPETFLNVVRMGSTVGPFLLAVATIVWIGLRGAKPGRRLVAWGCALLLTPMLMWIGLAMLLPSGNPLRLLSTPRLIARRLPDQVDEPWVWRELETRLNDGELTIEEADNAVTKLSAYMKSTSPTGWNKPLSWQKDFLNSAIVNGMISEPVRTTLVEAFYGSTPTVRLTTPALNEDDQQFSIMIEYGNPWSNNSGLSTELVWDLKQVLLDGRLLKTLNYRKDFGRQATLTAESDLSPGSHELLIELDCALVDAAQLTGMPIDTLTPDQCQKVRKRWIGTATLPLNVAPAAEMDDVEQD